MSHMNMRIKDLNVGDKMWGCNYPNNQYQVIKVTDYSIYIAIMSATAQDIVHIGRYNNRTCQDYGLFKTREEMIDHRIAKAERALENEIAWKHTNIKDK